MKKYIAIAAIVAASVLAYGQSSISPLVNDINFREQVISNVNALVAYEAAGVSFTNSVSAAVTNLSITVINGQVTSVRINGTTLP